jgi:hypothetical protein
VQGSGGGRRRRVSWFMILHAAALRTWSNKRVPAERLSDHATLHHVVFPASGRYHGRPAASGPPQLAPLHAKSRAAWQLGRGVQDPSPRGQGIFICGI